MAKYIEREVLITKIKENAMTKFDWSETIDIDDLKQVIQDVPTADVVEVVRCKDCKHATFYNCKNDACYKEIICEYEIGTDDENFYCIYGEARTPKERGVDE